VLRVPRYTAVMEDSRFMPLDWLIRIMTLVISLGYFVMMEVLADCSGPSAAALRCTKRELVVAILSGRLIARLILPHH